MSSRAKIGLFLAFCSSVGLHGVAYAALSAEHRAMAPAHRISELSFELPPVATAEPAAEPPAKSEKAAPAAKAAPAPAKAKPPVDRSPARAAPTAVSAAPVLDLSGVTLSNETGAGFAMPLGDGSPLHGPIGLAANGARKAAALSTEPNTPKPPALVAAGDLSEHPRPPSLTALLRANYPAEARERGLRGSASLRARIDADGVIRSARVLTESSAGFGSACRRTVLGSHWSAPRDKNGGAVATEIVYTCHFEVDP
jgi:TonB family protein